MAAASLTYGRAILGRGCDPARAAHASKAWAPLLKCDVVCVTDDEALAAHLTSGVKFKAFFIAPGYCSLAKERRVGACDRHVLCGRGACLVRRLLTRAPDGPGMLALVEKHQPGCPVVFVEQVEHGLKQLAAVLDGAGAADLPDVKARPHGAGGHRRSH